MKYHSMRRVLVRGLQFVLVTSGMVVLTSFSIDATDSLHNSNTALSLLARQVTEAGCPLGTVELNLANASLCIDQYENSAGPSCPDKDPQSVAATQANLNVRECQSHSVTAASPWAFVSYHQAKSLCARRGMRLPTALEWYEAALATPDTGVCNTDGSKSLTGQKPECKSARGAYDAIGNVWEWVDEEVKDGRFHERPLPTEGYVRSIDTAGVALETGAVPDPILGQDYSWFTNTGVFAMLRGGYFGSGSDGGVFSVQAKSAPSFSSVATGFRCVVERG